MFDESPDKYIKDYDRWNISKKLLNERVLPDDLFFLEREIWWASIGVNIGKEIDGKNNLFERPILILKKFTEDTFLALPISSKEKNYGDFYSWFNKGETQTIYLQQIRFYTISRLLKLVGRMEVDEFEIIKQKVAELIIGKENTSQY